ncbi:MAG: zinc-binding alcohol dehydrogenase [Phycisphaerae bacterium]|nr:zinc-binding alcohol dehydrogenase [Phycisphaerae bacterium]NIP55831.1 zinc-binding alcohol dehydrogenase [Phycisphaerae bacterium]NIX32218.1 hypothetical protein [Phycisphaerae bacterium]
MVSTGTETLVALGMAATSGTDTGVEYVEGDFRFPIKYGYSLSGIDPEGSLVHCHHPHQELVWLREEDIYRVPANVSPTRAALLSNMETVLNAIWDAGDPFESDIVVCGFGNLGALLANTLRLWKGVKPIIVEVDVARRSHAISLGFSTVDPIESRVPCKLIFDTSGCERGLQFCIDTAELDGTVVTLSWFGRRTVTLKLGENFHRNRVRLISSQVSNIPSHLSASITKLKRKEIAAELLTDISYDYLIADPVPFEKAPDLFKALRDGVTSSKPIWILEY